MRTTDDGPNTMIIGGAGSKQLATHDFTTKDSGTREQFESGMQREIKAAQPRFDLLIPEGVPYSQQLLTRAAALVARGAEKYESRDWEKACTTEELEVFRASAFRHFMQWFTGETDEDHAAAVLFNVLAVETTAYQIAQLAAADDAEEQTR